MFFSFIFMNLYSSVAQSFFFIFSILFFIFMLVHFITVTFIVVFLIFFIIFSSVSLKAIPSILLIMREYFHIFLFATIFILITLDCWCSLKLILKIECSWLSIFWTILAEKYAFTHLTIWYSEVKPSYCSK